jgi:L-rhamnonate dehydratase
MRISDVEAILLKGEERYETRDTREEVTDQGDWLTIIKVSTDEGIVGWSDVETLAPAAVAIVGGPGMGAPGFQPIRDLLIGENPLEVARLWDKMYVGGAYYGRRGVAMHCMSAIDNCLWSIRAQAFGVSLCELLGARRHGRVLAYASTLFRTTPEANHDAAEDYVERGFRAVKFGWGPFGEDAGRDRASLEAIREALGPERHLMIDPGWYGAGHKDPWRMRSVRENLQLCELVVPFAPTWLEDFIHPERFEEYAFVRSRTDVPIAAGEALATMWDFRRLVREGCVDIFQPDLSRCGGLSVAKQIADLADEHNIDLVPHSWLTDLLHGYSLHLLAAQPRARFVEFNVAQSRLSRGVSRGSFALEDDGCLRVPEGSGVGVEVDTQFIEAHRAH